MGLNRDAPYLQIYLQSPCSSMELQMILAYADDIVILSEIQADLERFLDEFVPTADSVCLELNVVKSQLLTRDPTNLQN